MFQINGNLDIRTCEHMILGQLRMGARQAKNAPLGLIKVRPPQNQSLVSINSKNLIRGSVQVFCKKLQHDICMCIT